jgi:hypothetical protein
MSTTIRLVAPAALLFQAGDEKKSIVANRETNLFGPNSIGEPEQRLWKLSARAASPRFAIIEVFILVLFLVLALVAIVSCLAELSHLLQSDAVGRVAAMAINGSV